MEQVSCVPDQGQGEGEVLEEEVLQGGGGGGAGGGAAGGLVGVPVGCTPVILVQVTVWVADIVIGGIGVIGEIGVGRVIISK